MYRKGSKKGKYFLTRIALPKKSSKSERLVSFSEIYEQHTLNSDLDGKSHTAQDLHVKKNPLFDEAVPPLRAPVVNSCAIVEQDDTDAESCFSYDSESSGGAHSDRVCARVLVHRDNTSSAGNVNEAFDSSLISETPSGVLNYFDKMLAHNLSESSFSCNETSLSEKINHKHAETFSYRPLKDIGGDNTQANYFEMDKSLLMEVDMRGVDSSCSTNGNEESILIGRRDSAEKSFVLSQASDLRGLDSDSILDLPAVCFQLTEDAKPTDSFEEIDARSSEDSEAKSVYLLLMLLEADFPDKFYDNLFASESFARSMSPCLRYREFLQLYLNSHL